MFKFENLEEAFKNNIDVAEKSLRNIGIDVKDEQRNYKSFLTVLQEVAKTFKKTNADDLVKLSVIHSMVGVRYFNHAIMIIDEINGNKEIL